jgi:hypothetical protein
MTAERDRRSFRNVIIAFAIVEALVLVTTIVLALNK